MSANQLLRFPTIIDVSVRWGDMDAFQHVNNALYFRYFESARIAYFEQLGLAEFMAGQSIGPILASISCRFRFPVTYPDTLRVGARVTQLGADRFVMAHRAVSTHHARVAAEGDGLVVSYDYAKQSKAPLPGDVRARILELEASVAHTPTELAAR